MAGGYEIALWCLLIAACITDLRVGKIFNAITLPFLAGGILVRFFGGGLPQLEASLLSIFTAFVLFFPLYWLKVLAAGDVKLLMAVGAWSTQHFILALAMHTVIIGCLVGLIILAQAKFLKKPTPKGGTRMALGPAFLCAFSFLRIAEIRGWSF